MSTDDVPVPQRPARRIPSIRTALLTAAVIPGLALTGCSMLQASPASSAVSAPSSPAGAASGTASATPSTSPTASALLGCDDLVSEQDVAAALTGPRSPAERTVTRISGAGGLVTGEKAIQGAGGLSCSWTVGSGSQRAGVLTADVLPGAADDWTPSFGDGLIATRRTVAGVSAAADCGDPGCRVTAAIGDSWVRVDVQIDGYSGTTSVFGGESEDAILDAEQPAVESVFRAVQHAPAARLRFPSHVAEKKAPTCSALLGTEAMARAMGVDAVRYDTEYQSTPVSDSLTGAALQRIGALTCDAEPTGSEPGATVDILPGQAWAVDDLLSVPERQGDAKPVTLQGQPSGEHALSSCPGDGSLNSCTVVLRVNGSAVQVSNSLRSDRIAEAILAANR